MTDKAIEAGARRFCEDAGLTWADIPEANKDTCRKRSQSVITAYKAHLEAEGMVEVARELLTPFALTYDDYSSQSDSESCMVLTGWCREVKEALFDAEVNRVVQKLKDDGLRHGRDFEVVEEP